MLSNKKENKLSKKGISDRVRKIWIYTKKRFNYFAAFGIFLIVIFSISLAYFYINSYNFYKSEIKTFIISPVTIDNRTYDIADGEAYLGGKKIMPNIGSLPLRFKILRLAFYSVQARIDPLFGLEGQDINKLNHSIELIQRSNENLPDLKGIEDNKLFRDSIVPLQFLLKIKDLETARRSLVEQPSQGAAEKYNKSLEDTINSYIASLQNFKQIATQIQQLGSQIANKDINFLGGSSNILSYEKLINSLELNAINKRNELSDRMSCFEGHWKTCASLRNSLIKNLPPGKNNEISRGNFNNFDDFHTAYGYQYDIIASFLKKQGTKYYYSPKPIIGVKTQCFGNDQISDYSFFMSTWLRTKNNSIFRPRLINNLFFFDLPKISSSYYNPLRKKGYQYFWQPETGFYGCPDLDYQSKLLSLNEIMDSLKRNPIFANLNTEDQILIKEKTAEKTLSNDVVNEGNFDDYFTSATQLLSDRGEDAISRIIGRQKLLDFEKLLNIYKQNSAELSELIISGWKQNKNFQKMTKENKDKMAQNSDDPAYYFVRRSAPAIYYLTSNTTITEKNPQFFDKLWLKIPDDYPIENLFTIETSSREDILNIMSDSDRLIKLNKMSEEN